MRPISHSNIYLCPKMNLIDTVETIKDLGITSSNCNFNQHINNVYKQCSRLSGWILRTFISRDSLTLLTLFKVIEKCKISILEPKNYPRSSKN